MTERESEPQTPSSPPRPSGEPPKLPEPPPFDPDLSLIGDMQRGEKPTNNQR